MLTEKLKKEGYRVRNKTLTSEKKGYKRIYIRKITVSLNGRTKIIESQFSEHSNYKRQYGAYGIKVYYKNRITGETYIERKSKILSSELYKIIIRRFRKI